MGKTVSLCSMGIPKHPQQRGMNKRGAQHVRHSSFIQQLEVWHLKVFFRYQPKHTQLKMFPMCCCLLMHQQAMTHLLYSNKGKLRTLCLLKKKLI
ncbi:hypothetical protein PR048_004860 [Dryococelus australis]|uniref:Uncharacterized protein n=1 Tax=Dryococelus australis TaxID=614101 RepID=A0ABQ9I6M7_9NEOP|nr:hypothetical protein PR048_004860 [Dryococelus australis]